MRLFWRPGFVLALGLALAGCDRAEEASDGPRGVDGARIINADAEPGNWLSHGRTYDEQRFSPLDRINDTNAGSLGLAWYLDLDTARGQEATPLIVDGVMYLTTAWSMVKALDAATGAVIWEYDPEVPRGWGVKACCDVVNRGLAIWGDKLYLGALDGRLIAIDAASGRPVWQVVTVDQTKPYTITGAPRIVKGKVLIGNGGAEYGVRGYISAYDADTGDLVWRFFTVPGDPAEPFESPALEAAAKTWTGEYWKLGGGGTVWDSMAYDADLDLLYIGVGNGSPWDRDVRSPGGGDNLYLSSIVALRPDTGDYVWHYQTTPGDNWDYTATQHIILADIEIDGAPRKVLMQAPKNGFFYVLDRATGDFISAEAFVPLNWASGIDPETGRPIENPDARYRSAGKPWLAAPGPAGAHNWHPMSFSPDTGLVYLPAQETGFVYAADLDFTSKSLAFNTGIDLSAASLPQVAAIKKAVLASLKGYLTAWDPVTQREVWRVQHKGPWNGGVLSTAGNLVVQGLATGDFAVYRADNGEELWSTAVQTGVVAAPVSYMADGEQYIAVLAGWGGAFALAPGELSGKSGTTRNISRVLAFKLGGTASLPPLPDEQPVPLEPPDQTGDAQSILAGKSIYHRFCGICHGDSAVAGGLIPDLRYSASLADEGWFDIVLGGALDANGMVSFAPDLDRDQVAAIRDYVIARGHESKAESGAAHEQE